jgi:hypothetical protein
LAVLRLYNLLVLALRRRHPGPELTKPRLQHLPVHLEGVIAAQNVDGPATRPRSAADLSDSISTTTRKRAVARAPTARSAELTRCPCPAAGLTLGAGPCAAPVHRA